MAVWDYKLDLSDVFEDFETVGFEDSRDEVVRRIKTSEFYDADDGELVYLVGQLEDADDPDEFNYDWASMYDWADANRVWLNTF